MISYTKQYVADLKKIRDIIPGLPNIYNKSILVTGANGLICSAVVDFLLELNHTCNAGINIYAAGRNEEKMKERFQNRVNYDGFYFFPYYAENKLLSDLRFDYIIHGASNAHPSRFLNEPVDTILANIYGIRNLLDYVQNGKADRVLFISSSEVYGKKEGSEPYGEEDYGFVDILNPRACYPSSKRAAETLCAAYIQQYGIDAVIVRPGHVYGPTMTDSDSRASSQFPRDVKQGKDILMKSAGLQMRSYCYVLDCVSAIITVLLNGKRGEAYNISNRESIVSIREMAENFANASGKKVIFEIATEEEKKGYNLMDNSSLKSEKLEALGWKGLFDMSIGAQRTLDAMK